MERLLKAACVFVAASFVQVSGAAAADLVVIHPRPESATDTRFAYDWALLAEALDHARTEYGAYVVKPADSAMNEVRVMEEIAQNTGAVDIIARPTSVDEERKLLPIRIPTDKGLLGYRVFLIRKEDQPKFSAVRTLDDLREFSIGQGAQWIGVKVLEAGGFKVVTGSTYDGLFSMLASGRFDAFSRSLGEAYREYGERKGAYPTMAIEESLILYYPFPRYFFVGRHAKGQEIARRLEAGLAMMAKDGSYSALFEKFHGGVIKAMNVKNRRIFRIGNPVLPPETPLNRRELWYDPLAQ